MRGLKLFECFRPHDSGRMATRAEGGRVLPSLPVHDALSHDGPRRVARAQKKYVVVRLHTRYPFQTPFGPLSEL